MRSAGPLLNDAYWVFVAAKLPGAGDDEEAKTLARAQVTDLGFDVFDPGTLRQARLLEPLAMLWIDQAVNRGTLTTSAFSFMQKADRR